MAPVNDTMTTPAGQDASMPLFAEKEYILPIICILGAIILILSVILIVIFCRRKIRAQKIRSSDEMNVRVIKTSPQSDNVDSCEAKPKGVANGNFKSSTAILGDNKSPSLGERKESNSSLGRLNEQPQKSVTHAPVPGLPGLRPLSNGSYHSNQDFVALYGDDNPSPAVHVVPPPPTVKCPTPPLCGEITTPLSETGEESPCLIDSLHSPTSVLSTPDMHKLRGRRSRNGPVSPTLLESKETTLQRASNLFRSDTKAYEFYTKTKTNYEMSRSNIQSSRIIGKGHFGCVYMGTASKLPTDKRRNIKIAIKTMKNSAPDSEKQEFLYELEIMKLVSSLNHPNIIKLLGCVTKAQPYLIVLELMACGNLQRFMRETKTQDVYYNLHGKSDRLNEQHLLKFALDIARGMEGIADLQLLHRDLACRNILIDENLTCKVADFGFAKDVLNKPDYKSKSVFQRPRPTRWLPPESLFFFKHCIQSDVWSYGVVLWEIVTLGNLPYPNMSTREVSNI